MAKCKVCGAPVNVAPDGDPGMTLSDIIEGRSKLPRDDEIKAWAADRRRAEDVYLATARLCDERIMAAVQRMDAAREGSP